VRLATEEAADLQIPFTRTIVVGADADSSSFLVGGIPAITISGLTQTGVNSIIHSSRDQVSRVNSSSVFLGYELALALWNQIDAAPCSAYRY
jgi:hypothetical protein